MQPADTLPVVTPIRVEIDNGLVPKVDPKSDGGKFIAENDVMRQRILAHTGLTIPGVRYRRARSFPEPDRYLIMLDEVPIASGATRIDMGYCPTPIERIVALGIPPSDLVEAGNPRTGETGWWVPWEHTGTLKTEALEVWTDTDFLLCHLETVLRQNLANFLGVQEAETLIQEWSKDKESAAFITAALPDSRTRLRFARVLRALVSENIPITRWQSILKVFQDVELEGGDISEVVRRVRLEGQPTLSVGEARLDEGVKRDG